MQHLLHRKEEQGALGENPIILEEITMLLGKSISAPRTTRKCFKIKPRLRFK